MIPLPPDFLLELYAAYPEIFNKTVKDGFTVLKVVTPKLRESWPKIKEFFKNKTKNNTVPVVLKNYTDAYIELRNNASREDLLLLQKHMPQDLYSMVLLGYQALHAKTKLDQERVRQIKLDASKAKGKDGVQIINFVIQGYFEEIFIPLLEHQVKNLKSESERTFWFTQFIASQLAFFPRAIWVRNDTTTSEIEQELRRRCIASGFEEINIHTVGTRNLKKIKQSLTNLATDTTMPKFNYGEPKKDVPGFHAFTIKFRVVKE